MKSKIVTLILVIAIVFAKTSTAETVQLDLIGLGCPTEFNADSVSWQTNFDFGVTFVEISYVYINWSGQITGGLSAGSSEPIPFDEGIAAVLGTYPNWRHIGVDGGKTDYPSPEEFDELSEFIYGSMPLSELFDGQGTIRIGMAGLVTIPEITILERGSVTLESAVLVVDGIVVPEPGTLLLLGIGVIGNRMRF